MKKIWYLAFLMICSLMVTSCGDDDDDDVSQEWKDANFKAFYDISADKVNYKEIISESKAGSIYVKKLKEGDGTKRIFYNSTVKLHYKGSYYEGTVFDDSHESYYKEPVTAEAKSFIDGFTTALQWMTEGDHWDVWIPYQLAYGTAGYTSGNTSIPGYSTLHFEIEIVEILDEVK